MLACHLPSEEMVKHLEHYYCGLAKLSQSHPGDQHHRANSQILQKVEGNMEAMLLHTLTYHPECDAVQAGLYFTSFLYWTKPKTTIISLAAKVAEDLKEGELKARCLQSLGNILRMQSKNDEASSALTDARAQFEAIGDHHGATQCTKDWETSSGCSPSMMRPALL